MLSYLGSQHVQTYGVEEELETNKAPGLRATPYYSEA